MYVLIIILYEQFSEGFRFLVLSFQPTHPPAPKSKFSLNTLVGHADADAMPIRNMRRMYRSISDICPRCGLRMANLNRVPAWQVEPD